jgi:hypothetical protein
VLEGVREKTQAAKVSGAPRERDLAGWGRHSVPEAFGEQQVLPRMNSSNRDAVRHRWIGPGVFAKLFRGWIYEEKNREQ